MPPANEGSEASADAKAMFLYRVEFLNETFEATADTAPPLPVWLVMDPFPTDCGVVCKEDSASSPTAFLVKLQATNRVPTDEDTISSSSKSLLKLSSTAPPDAVVPPMPDTALFELNAHLSNIGCALYTKAAPPLPLLVL
mmetsp:Transcript_13950/g.20689  ORF Transcript_13950/g.20689 Transcript_13950/m.20689 type:complete len:140 (-) Transcript_13950:2203-2622(-)